MTDASAVLRKGLHDHWRMFLIEGIVLIALGAGAILVPQVASIAVDIFLGWIFLVGGAIGLVTSIMGRTAPGFWWSLLSSIVTLIAGFALLGWPLAGTISITLILTAFLFTDGVLMALFAIEHRRQLSQRWVFLLINGILDVFLGALILLWLPGSALWILGLIVGIDLVFGGTALVALAMAARRA